MKDFILRRIPNDLHVRLKLLAVKRTDLEGREISMREIILEAIQEKLERESDPKQ